MQLYTCRLCAVPFLQAFMYLRWNTIKNRINGTYADMNYVTQDYFYSEVRFGNNVMPTHYSGYVYEDTNMYKFIVLCKM